MAELRKDDLALRIVLLALESFPIPSRGLGLLENFGIVIALRKDESKRMIAYVSPLESASHVTFIRMECIAIS